MVTSPARNWLALSSGREDQGVGQVDSETPWGKCPKLSAANPFCARWRPKSTEKLPLLVTLSAVQDGKENDP